MYFPSIMKYANISPYSKKERAVAIDHVLTVISTLDELF